MAHLAQFEYFEKLKNKFPIFFKNNKVLEIGSLNINGTCRSFFDNCDYIGVDLGPGNGVDIVCEGQNLDHPANSYDVVLSSNCFEHNPFWIETFNNMYRMTKPDGLLIMTCASDGHKEHGTSRSSPKKSPLTIKKGWEYYKNLNEIDFRKNFNIDSLFQEYEFSSNLVSKDLYFFGFKKS